MGDIPACMTWLVPTPGTDYQDWQDGRCGFCGRTIEDFAPKRMKMVLDHDHATGLVRGYLCRPCNSSEGQGNPRRWWRWRAGWNPASLLGTDEEYVGWGWGWEQMERAMPPATMDELREAVNLLPGA